MSPHTMHEAAAPTGAEITTLYVAIEISRKSWVVGIKSPLGEKIGLHTLGAADVASLRGLLEQHRVRAQRTLGQAAQLFDGAVRGFSQHTFGSAHDALRCDRSDGLRPALSDEDHPQRAPVCASG